VEKRINEIEVEEYLRYITHTSYIIHMELNKHTCTYIYIYIYIYIYVNIYIFMLHVHKFVYIIFHIGLRMVKNK
jgi:hypothetical protein